MAIEFLKAKPIWKKGESKLKNSACAFYATFKSSPNVELRICCCNVYKLYVNGVFINVGPARAAHGYYRMDVLKLNDLKENNVIFIEASAYNTNNYCHLNSPGFLQAEVLSDGNPLIWTGEHFLVRTYTERLREVSRYSFQRAFTEVYDFEKNPYDEYANPKNGLKTYEQPEIVSSGNIIERVVSYSEYDKYSAQLIETGEFALGEVSESRNNFTDDERLNVYPVKEWKSYSCDILPNIGYSLKKLGNTLKKGEYRAYDFSASQSGFIHIKFSSLKNSVIYIIFDSIDLREDGESLCKIDFRRGCGFDVLEYRVKKGEFEHITIEPYVLRYLKVLVMDGELSEFSVEITGYENPDTQRFYFNCEKDSLNKIVQAGIRTFKANAADLLTDCPSRERAGWLCDAYFLAKTEQLLTGENKVESVFLQNYALAPKLKYIPEGILPMCYPADFIDMQHNYIPNWTFWYVVELLDNYKRTGDYHNAETSREKVYKLFEFFSKYLNQDGLLENLDGWVFVEWSMANDPTFICGVNYPSNMMYAKALKSAGELYGDEKLTLQAERIFGKIIEQSYNGEFFEDNRVRENGKLVRTGNVSETCQYYAFFCGLAKKRNYPELYNALITQFGSTRNQKIVYPNVHKSNAFIGNYLRLIIMLENGDGQRIPKESAEFFYNMSVKTGTLWEHDDVCGSLNHGFASFAVNVMVAYMCGYCGCNGKRLLFSQCVCLEDCEIHIPIKDKELIFIRKNGNATMRVPDGFEIVRV